MKTEREYIVEISNQLKEASSSVRILRNIAWPLEVKEEFFRQKEQKLPEVSYAPFDPAPVLGQLKEIRQHIRGSDVIQEWAHRITNTIENSALMLSARGTQDFFKYSEVLYGKPTDLLKNGECTTLELANHFDSMFNRVKDLNVGMPSDIYVSAETLADEMKKAVAETFGDLAPEIVMDDSLASNALAGRRRVSIRPSANFIDKDIDQLINHELYVHVATSINGNLQKNIRILGEGHPGTTKTQEGIAVFAEFITGSIDLDRVRRLSDRVIAIQMAIDGANFIDIYRFYLEKTDKKDQSFESAKRVFRGGVLTGKAPYTKDMVYLEGLVTVHNFLKLALSTGKLEYFDLLFCGKLDISDLPALKELKEAKLIEPPRFMPPWARDKRYLLSYLSYSSFLTGINLDRLKVYYDSILK